MNEKNQSRIENNKEPRAKGITMIIDKGLGISQAFDLASSYGRFIDFVKIAFASSRVVDPEILKRKIHNYQKTGIEVFFGGTTFESFMAEDLSLDDFSDFVRGFGLKYVEISDGRIDLNVNRKIEIINQLNQNGFRVFAEIGKKNPGIIFNDDDWISGVRVALEADAFKVILEARESGRVGIYKTDKTPKYDLIDKILANFSANQIIFEAPEASQQNFFINRIGSNVNLGNIKPEDVVALETARRGLRADTLDV